MRMGAGYLLSGTNYAKQRLEEMAGEWETDKSGRRYRRIGHSIEYEPVIVINGINIPYSQLEAFYKNQREAKKENRYSGSCF